MVSLELGRTLAESPSGFDLGRESMKSETSGSRNQRQMARALLLSSNRR